MNLYDSSFLCLDIGTSAVHGIAHRVRGGRLDKSAMFSIDSYDTVFAIKSVVDELERQIGTRFDSAYITGNLGESRFETPIKTSAWNGEHKITPADMRAQISGITPPDGYFPMHIIPLRYDTPTVRDMTNPIGHTDWQLKSIFAAIFYPRARMGEVCAFLRRAHIQPTAFYDAAFLQNAVFRRKMGPAMFINIGAAVAAASIWTDRGPVWHTRINRGGTEITTALARTLNIDFEEAERIKRTVLSMIPKEMNRFTPADAAYAFSHADVNDVATPMVTEIISEIHNAAAPAIEKYGPVKIFLSGGMSGVEGIADYIAGTFGIDVKVINGDATVRALSQFVWDADEAHRKAFLERHDRWHARTSWIRKMFGAKKRARTAPRFIPVMPSTLCFNMRSPLTYAMFTAAGISMLHIDVMDGLYVNSIEGTPDELKYIRAHTRAHLHVHLMTQSAIAAATDAIESGADTIIVSAGTSGVRDALHAIKAAGKRAGVAIAPDIGITVLRDVLRDLDEVMIMTVTPGAAGQTFRPDCLNKISQLAATRKKYGLKFTISVDGGINDKTAQMCWNAGADLLVSGSYLSHSTDFALAVQSLLKQPA